MQVPDSSHQMTKVSSVVISALLIASVTIGFVGVGGAAPVDTQSVEPGETVTITYEFTSGSGTRYSTSVGTIESPDWSVRGAQLTISNDSSERSAEWRNSLEQKDTWVLEEPFGPNETLTVTVTYEVPEDASGGWHQFEAASQIGGKWQRSSDAVQVDAPTDDDDGGTDTGDDGGTAEPTTETVTYEFTSGASTRYSTAIGTIESPDWSVRGAQLTITNESGDRAAEWRNSLEQADTWILEEPFGPNETLTVTVTYEVPADASGGWHTFEAASQIGGEWQRSSDAIQVETVDEGDSGSDDSSDDDSLEFDVTNATVELNSSATAETSFSVTNVGSTDLSSVGVNVTHVPDEFTIEDQDSSGSWASNQLAWFWVSPLAPNDTVASTLTLLVPDGTDPGTYEIRAVADTGSGSVERVATVTVENASASDGDQSSTVVEAIAGQDGQVGFTEVLDAISAFNNGNQINGFDIGFAEVLDAISAFNTGESIATP